MLFKKGYDEIQYRFNRILTFCRLQHAAISTKTQNWLVHLLAFAASTAPLKQKPR